MTTKIARGVWTTRNPEQRARQKVNALSRHLGRPALMDNTATLRHVRWLHDVHGMTLSQIATASGVALTTVWNVYTQHCKQIQRTQHDKIMAARPEAVTTGFGAFLDATGTHRRLGALTFKGFPLKFLAPYVGIARTNLERYARGDNRLVYASTERAVRAVFDKLINTDPSDHGITDVAQKVARFYAHKRASAPEHAWDDDTIDDPDTIPEWTGRCGTSQGYTMHYHQKIITGYMPPQRMIGPTHDQVSVAGLMGDAGVRRLAETLPDRYERVLKTVRNDYAAAVMKDNGVACKECRAAHNLMKRFPQLGYLMGLQEEGARGKYGNERARERTTSEDTR